MECPLRCAPTTTEGGVLRELLRSYFRELDRVETAEATRALRRAARRAVLSPAVLLALAAAGGLCIIGADLAGWWGIATLGGIGTLLVGVVIVQDTRAALWQDGFGHTEPVPHDGL